MHVYIYIYCRTYINTLNNATYYVFESHTKYNQSLTKSIHRIITGESMITPPPCGSRYKRALLVVWEPILACRTNSLTFTSAEGTNRLIRLDFPFR